MMQNKTKQAQQGDLRDRENACFKFEKYIQFIVGRLLLSMLLFISFFFRSVTLIYNE